MASAQNVIKNFMSTLDSTSLKGEKALDEAVKSVSKFSSWSELTETMVSDCKAYGGNYSGFLKDMCDIVLDNEDTGAISGSDAGGGSTKTAESIVPESGSINYPTSNSFTIQGLKVTVPELSTLDDSKKFIVGALYTWWIDSALTLIKDSFGLNFKEPGTTVDAIDITFYNSSTDRQMAVTSYSKTQKCSELHLRLNMNYYDSIDTSNPNGVGSSSALTYLDRTIAHEMVHAVMAANFDYFNDFPTIFKEGSAELLHGIDDKRRTNIQSIASDSSALQSALSGGSTNTYAAGYMVLRYLAKQAAANRNPSASIGVSSTSELQSISTATSTANTTTTVSTTTVSGTTLIVKSNCTDDIWLGEKNLLTNKSSNHSNENILTLDATKAASTLIFAGNNQNNTIKVGSSGSSIWGGASGNDSLIGGAGRDVFWYANGGGNDVVQNFTCGTDSTGDILTVTDTNFSLNRADGNLTFIMADGGTFAVSVGSDVDKAIQYSTDGRNIIGVKVGNNESENNFTYEKNLYYLGGNGTNILTVNDSDNASIFLSDGNFVNINVVNAQNSSSQNILAGNNLDNQILAGSGNSSLWGGNSTSNDVLTGGNGENMFWYGIGEGNDAVNNADSNDVVNLYNVALNDVAGFEDFESGVKINLSSGSITINTTETPKFMLSDGSSYRYDRNSKNWQTAD